eukprot:6177957-Pleurochrysis_carterae.AAC.2
MRRAAMLLTPAPSAMTLLSAWRVKLRAAVAAAEATDAKACVPFSKPLLEARCRLNRARRTESCKDDVSVSQCHGCL